MSISRAFMRVFSGATLLVFDLLPLSIKRLCERRARQATADHMLPILWNHASDEIRKRFVKHCREEIEEFKREKKYSFWVRFYRKIVCRRVRKHGVIARGQK